MIRELFERPPLRLLIAGNSVSLPPMEGVAAYPDLLEARLGQKWKIFTIIRGGETIDEFETELLSVLDEIMPHALVLQVGINECAPRPLKRGEREQLGRLRPRWLQSAIIGLIHRYRTQIIRTRGLIQFTPLPIFTETVRRVVMKATSLNCNVLMLPIMSVTSAAESRHLFIGWEIECFNNLLRSLSAPGVTFVEQKELLGDVKPEDFCMAPQNVHLRGWAHEKIAMYVAGWLECQAQRSAHGSGKMSQ